MKKKLFSLIIVCALFFVIQPTTTVSADTWNPGKAVWVACINGATIEREAPYLDIELNCSNGKLYITSFLNYIGYNYNNDPLCVKMLQAGLNRLGYNAGTVDGIFGPNTHSALLRFQSTYGLSCDAICGPNTWTKLQNVLNGAILPILLFT